MCEGEEDGDDIEFYFAGGAESLKRQMEEIPELDAEFVFCVLISRIIISPYFKCSFVLLVKKKAFSD